VFLRAEAQQDTGWRWVARMATAMCSEANGAAMSCRLIGRVNLTGGRRGATTPKPTRCTELPRSMLACHPPKLAPWLDPCVQTTNVIWFGAVWVGKRNGLVRVGFF
jgi:hypothetical protein